MKKSLLFALLPLLAGAQSLWAGEMTLAQLWAAAKAAHPTVTVAAAERAAMQAEARQARAWENPEIELEGENLGGDASGTDEAEWTLSLAQSIPFPGRQARKRAQARLLNDTAVLQQQASLRALSVRVAREFYETLALQETMMLQLEAVEQAERFVEMAGFRVKVGTSTDLEVNKAELELAAQRLELQQNENALVNAMAHLSRMVDAPVDLLVADWQQAPAAPDMAKLRAALEDTAAYALQDAEVAQRSLELKEAKRAWLPDVVVTGGVRQDDAEDVQSYLGTVGFVLPLWQRGGNAQAAAEAKLQQAKGERALASQAFEGRVAELAAGLSLRWQEQQQYRETLLPLLERHAAQAEKSYREGFSGYLEYLEARDDLRRGQMAYIEALKNYHIAYQEFKTLSDVDSDEENDDEK